MYVYDYNVILTAATNNIIVREMIWAFTKLTKYLKSRRIIPGLHFMYNKESTALKIAMITMDIN